MVEANGEIWWFFPPKKKVEIWLLEKKNTHIFSAILKKKIARKIEGK